MSTRRRRRDQGTQTHLNAHNVYVRIYYVHLFHITDQCRNLSRCFVSGRFAADVVVVVAVGWRRYVTKLLANSWHRDFIWHTSARKTAAEINNRARRGGSPFECCRQLCAIRMYVHTYVRKCVITILFFFRVCVAAAGRVVHCSATCACACSCVRFRCNVGHFIKSFCILRFGHRRRQRRRSMAYDGRLNNKLTHTHT